MGPLLAHAKPNIEANNRIEDNMTEANRIDRNSRFDES